MKYRYERKYLVRNECLNALRKRMAPFLVHDSFAPEKENGLFQYTVRSVYYDTPEFNSLYEKWEGVEVRKKLRIRGYGFEEADSMVFMEIKRKLGDRIWKNRAQVRFDAVHELLKTGFSNGAGEQIKGRNEEDARKFLFNLYRYGYRPVNLIAYEREPFHGKFDHGVRITFDKNIRCKMWPSLKQLFSENGLRLVWKDFFILEIKYFENKMPTWAKSIVQEFGLRHEALSKFATPFGRKDVSVFNLKIDG